MSCDPTRPKAVCAGLGATGLPDTPAARRKPLIPDEAIALHSIHMGRKSHYAIFYVQLQAESGGFKRGRVRLDLGRDMGWVTKNPAYGGLELSELDGAGKVGFRVAADGIDLRYSRPIIVSLNKPVSWEKVQREKREIIRGGIQDMIASGRRVPHRYLVDYPDLIDAYLSSPGGELDQGQDPKEVIRLRLQASQEVDPGVLVCYPDLLAEYGLI